jgi:hypothetical protein
MVKDMKIERVFLVDSAANTPSVNVFPSSFLGFGHTVLKGNRGEQSSKQNRRESLERVITYPLNQKKQQKIIHRCFNIFMNDNYSKRSPWLNMSWFKELCTFIRPVKKRMRVRQKHPQRKKRETLALNLIVVSR